MTVLVDYMYTNGTVPAPTPRKLAAIRPFLTTNSPLPPPRPPPAAKVSPPSHDVDDLAINPTAFFWEAVTVGYGAPADYGIYWLLNRINLDPDQIEDLKRLAASRATMISRAYRFDTSSGTLLLQQRDIYPLIEQSEKVNISYNLGCAMAAVCAPRAIATRAAPTVVALSPLYHARLLACVENVTNTIIVNRSSNKQVDFVAFDANLGAHIIEAKGGGDSFPYAELADGIDQCNAVDDVTLAGLPPVAPASLTVSVAFLAKLKVNCRAAAGGGADFTIKQGIRCATFEIMPPAVPAVAAPVATPPVPVPAVAPITNDTVLTLLGTRALGLHLFLQTASAAPDQGLWAIYSFTQEIGFEVPITVAVPRALVTTAQQRWDDCQIAIKLNGLPAPTVPVAGNIDIAVMLRTLGKDVEFFSAWRDITPPPGFQRFASSPWVAFETQ